MPNCNTECVGKYLVNPLRTPVAQLDYEVLTPWVKLSFKGNDGQFITVGNKSAPSVENTACITSFEYGATQAGGSGGHHMKVEIIDERGGEFTKFADSLHKCITKSTKDYSMQVQWGWLGASCMGGVQKIPSSPVVITAIPALMEVSFSEGKVKYNIVGTDIGQIIFTARAELVYGTEANKMHLKEAITKMSKEVNPTFAVDWKDNNGQEIKFADGGEKGPLGVWRCNRQNKIAVISDWLNDYTTTNGKGFMVLWDNKQSTPTLRIIENIFPKCNEKPKADDEKHSLGTFIVNAGPCSNVLEFNPSFTWLTGFSKSGANSEGLSSEGGKTAKDSTDCENKKQTDAGTSSNTAIDQNAAETYGDQTSTKIPAANAANAHGIAGTHIISAEMRIMGNAEAEFIYPTLLAKFYCSVVVINPFHISGSGCGDWLAQPMCNQVLSNKAWMVSGVNHYIKDGSYTTTLKLDLAAPGIDAPSGPLGGSGSGGYKPQGLCD
jgi:hypothetical protein